MDDQSGLTLGLFVLLLRFPLKIFTKLELVNTDAILNIFSIVNFAFCFDRFNICDDR